MLMLLLALVLAFVCFKLGVLLTVVSIIAIGIKVISVGILILVAYCFWRWWRKRPARRIP